MIQRHRIIMYLDITVKDKKQKRFRLEQLISGKSKVQNTIAFHLGPVVPPRTDYSP